MALSKHMQGNRHYSAIKPVRICGSFEPNGVSAPTGLRGAGFAVTRTGVGLITITLAETPRRVIGYGADIADANFNGTNPGSAEISAFTGAAISLQISQWGGTAWAAVDYPQDATNHNTKISFWVETEESSAPLR